MTVAILQFSDQGHRKPLLCPSCGSEYLHLQGMGSSEADQGALLAFLRFDCENCHKRSVLHVDNEKGHTTMAWGDDPLSLLEMFDAAP